MLRVNEIKTQMLDSRKLLVVIDGDRRDEFEGLDAQDLATKTAAARGIINGCLQAIPVVGAVDEATGEVVDRIDTQIQVACFRAAYAFVPAI